VTLFEDDQELRKMAQLGRSIMLIMSHESYHSSGKYNGIGRPDKVITIHSGVVMIQDPRSSTKHGVTSKDHPQLLRIVILPKLNSAESEREIFYLGTLSVAFHG
jgi:hypothetical protein